MSPRVRRPTKRPKAVIAAARDPLKGREWRELSEPIVASWFLRSRPPQPHFQTTSGFPCQALPGLAPLDLIVGPSPLLPPIPQVLRVSYRQASARFFVRWPGSLPSFQSPSKSHRQYAKSDPDRVPAAHVTIVWTGRERLSSAMLENKGPTRH
jgi:hypothetical protein